MGCDGSSLLPFSSCGQQGLLFVMVHGLPIAVASLVAELWHHRLTCSMACGIFPDEGSNPCPLRWQADYYPLYH